MKGWIVLSALVVLLAGIFLYSQTQVKPAFHKATPTPTPTPKQIDIRAKFTIITNGITRSFKAEKYHNQSPDVFITGENPTTIHVKKEGITWDDFFRTLPMKLTKECLTTGDGETFCDGQDGNLRFYLNGLEDQDLLEKEIKENDSALIKFSSN